MSKRESKSNSKENLIKLKAPLFFSPSTQKKHTNIIKLNIEPKKIYQQTEYNLSKKKIKQKINLGNLNTNSKLFLKKNMTQNISALNFTESNITQENNVLKNILSNNIKFNIGKSSQNFLNSKNSVQNLKKNAASEYELLNNTNNENNFLKKQKGKNIIKLNNLNPIGFIYPSGNDKNNEPITQPSNGITPKIIFLKNEKQIQSSENIMQEEEKKDEINCVLRNTFTNVKIYPTTFLNNKIIFQSVDKNKNNNNDNNLSNKSDNSNSNNNNSTMKHNNSKIKKEKIVIDTEKHEKQSGKFQSIEELHYFFVDTLQKGKNIAIELDNCNL